MAGSAKRKGDWAEREIAGILSDLLGFPVRRKLGAGRLDDVGDLDGIPNHVVQAAWWPKKGHLRAVREKPIECERQQINAGATFGWAAIRLPGGIWRACLTLNQIATYIRETGADPRTGALTEIVERVMAQHWPACRCWFCRAGHDLGCRPSGTTLRGTLWPAVGQQITDAQYAHLTKGEP
jgi:hypothetical protein